MYISDQKIPWEYVWLEFDGLRAKEMITLAGLSPDHPVYKARYKDIAAEMKSEMLYIVNHKEESPFHLIGHLYLFIDSLVRSSTSTPLYSGNRLRDFYIKEAISFIEQNFQNDITVENIAASCGLNRSYFGKIFTGISDFLSYDQSRRTFKAYKAVNRGYRTGSGIPEPASFFKGI